MSLLVETVYVRSHDNERLDVWQQMIDLELSLYFCISLWPFQLYTRSARKHGSRTFVAFGSPAIHLQCCVALLTVLLSFSVSRFQAVARFLLG
jgi:hypothetical protein